jgi:hypothetical protein
MGIDASKQEAGRMKNDLEDILRRVDSLPIVDSRSEDEILGYDEQGLPEPPENKGAIGPSVSDTPRAANSPTSLPAPRKSKTVLNRDPAALCMYLLEPRRLLTSQRLGKG